MTYRMLPPAKCRSLSQRNGLATCRRAASPFSVMSCGSTRVEGELGLIDAEGVGQPVQHQFLPEGRIIVLTVVGPGFHLIGQPQGNGQPL